MHIPRGSRWRLAFVAAGVAMAVGGPLHPESEASEPLRQELATMAEGDTWVLSHSFLALGAALLAVGLWLAYRHRSWPASTHRALLVCAIAMSLYVVETVFHLASKVDTEELGNGDAAPVAFTHVGLSVVLYPLSGLAVAWICVKLFAAVTGPGKVPAVIGLCAGLLHAASVPLTLALPDAELTPVFAGAGMLFAAWGICFGLAGLRERALPRTPARSVLATASTNID